MVYQENEDGDRVKLLYTTNWPQRVSTLYNVQCTSTCVIHSFSKNNQLFLRSFSEITQANLKTLALS